MTEVLDTETGELTQVETPEDEPETDTEPETGDITEPEGRCEAVTTVGGTLYRCALQGDHDGEHSFQPVEADAPLEEPEPIDIDKASEKLKNEAMRHYKRLGEIMGDDHTMLVPCELCSPNLAGWRFEGLPPQDTIANVRVVIGMPDLSNFKPSATEARCDDCGGLGKVRTGSTVPQYETATCDACAGKGFRETRRRLNETAAPPALPIEANGAPAPPDDGIKRDMFGTPETDPDYGLMPNMRQRPTDYWQTNLV
jgi:hypothetical protein